MAKNCKHFNSISRCAVLLMLAAGASAAAKDMPAEGGVPATNPAVQKVIADETVLRTQILADIETQKKHAEKLTDDEKFSEADATFKALLQQLASIPGTEAKVKYEEIKKAQKRLHRKWAADTLEKAHDLFDAKNYNEAIRVCSIINSFDPENGPGISGPFIAKCNAAIEAQKYNDAVDIKKFNTSFVSNLQDIDRYMRQAETYYNNGKYEKVMEVLEKVYLLDPFNVRATTLLDKTYGKVFSRARGRHRVTTQEMLAQAEWAWVMPAKAAVPDKEMSKDSEVKAPQNDIELRMERIRFPKFDSPGMDIIKILKFLDAQSKANDNVTKDGPLGVTIIPQFEAADLKQPKFQKIYMRFSDIPLIDILRYLCLNLGIKYKVDKYGSVLVGTNVDDMVSEPRKFPVRDEVVADILGAGGAADSTPAPAVDGEETAGDGAETAAAVKTSSSANESKMKEYFRERGVEFPAGSAIRYNARAHRLEVINSEDNLRRLEALLAQLDSIDVPMVMTEVKFVEVTENHFNQLGFDWNFSLMDENRKNGLWSFNVGTNFISQEEQNNRPSAFIQNLNLLPNFDEDFGGLKPSLNVTVHALSQNDNVEVLTTPRLIAKNGLTASISMVTETRYPESWEAPEIETESDNVSTISFPVPDLGEATPIGITMTVTPSVGPDNETITLKLHPEIISFLGSENSGYPVPVQQGIINRDTGAMIPTMLNKSFNIWMPELGKRSIDAEVKVRNGETIVLGGVISSTVERKEEKMPLLGSIPILGRLFQNRSEESAKTNLLIFVTARLIKSKDGRPVKAVENNGTPHFNF